MDVVVSSTLQSPAVGCLRSHSERRREIFALMRRVEGNIFTNDYAKAVEEQPRNILLAKRFAVLSVRNVQII
jgi:hypothetical protein